MVRHIVLFKFKGDAAEDDRKGLIEALRGLKDRISVVRELEVGEDIGGKPNSYDIALNSVFDNFEDVEAYAVHPEHVKVVDMVRERCEASVKVDFEF